MTDAFWKSGAVITSSYAANGVSVAEYTLSQIIFCLNKGWYYVLNGQRQGKYIKRIPAPGAYGSIIGIISLGMIGRCVCELLKAFDVKIIAYDPFPDADMALKLGVELCGLEDVFRRADVVSLHTPLLDETRGMITGVHFASMKKDASFINTARGAIVKEEEMIEAVRQRLDLQIVLDVTYPEPPDLDSGLYDLPNMVLTPHIAGSLGNECRRMGRYMVDELERYLNSQSLKWQITEEQAAKLA